METSPLRCRPVAWANSRLLMTKWTKRNPTAVYSHCEAGGTGFLTIPLWGWSGVWVPSSLRGESFILVLFSCVRCIGLQVPPLETCCFSPEPVCGRVGILWREKDPDSFLLLFPSPWQKFVLTWQLFFIQNRAAFLSTITRVLTHLQRLPSLWRSSTCLLGGTDAPLSPFPEYFSVKGGAKHNRALRLRAGAGGIPAGRARQGLSPLLPPFPVDKFSFRSWFVLKSLRGVVLYLLRSWITSDLRRGAAPLWCRCCSVRPHGSVKVVFVSFSPPR